MHILRKGLICAAVIAALVGLQGTAASAHSGGGSVVVIGDSYAGGEGGTETGPYLPGSDTATNQCHRSATAPVAFVGAIWGKSTRNVACSGATTFNITTTGQYGEPSQASQIAGAKHVVVMIGGNDIGFGNLVGCFLQFDCDQTPLPAGTIAFINAQLGALLDAAYSSIDAAAAPNAKITVTLYPPLLPPNGAAVGPNCPQFNPTEIVLGNAVTDALNGVIADRARAHGFGVANPAPLFRGHDVCSTSPFFYLPSPTVPQAAWYHPDFFGRAALGAVTAFA